MVTQINQDYTKSQVDANNSKKLKKEHNKILAHLKVLAAGNNPMAVINYFMYTVMPEVLNSTENKVNEVSDKLMAVSDYRGLVAKAEGDFNKFSSIDPTNVAAANTAYTKLHSDVQAISNSLGLERVSTVLGPETTKTMQSAVNNLINGSSPMLGNNGVALAKIWKASSDPKDISGASGKLKSILSEFNTMNTATSTLGQTVHTKLTAQTTFFQQIMGIFNSALQAEISWNKNPIQGQRVN